MKCKRFKNESLRNEEWFQFLTEFKTLTEQYTPSALDIEALFSNFLSLYVNADDALEIIRKSATTGQIAEAYHLRGTVFRGLADAVKSACNHFDPQKKAAAGQLKIVLDHYGNIAGKAYDGGTASIYNLLQEMRGTHAADIATLNLGDWVAQLEADNQAFETLTKNRYTENSNKPDLRMSDVRIETDRCFRDILDRLDALMIVNGEASYLPFVKELNSRIDHYSNLIANRKGRSAKAKEKGKTEELI